MLKFSFVIFAIVAGVLGESDICDKPSFMVCDSGIRLDEIPGTEEELRATCDLGIQLFGCIIEHEGKCHPNGPYFEHAKDTKKFFEAFCSNDRLFQVVADNLPCFQQNFPRIVQCSFKEGEEYNEEEYMKALTKHGIGEISEHANETKLCLSELFSASCYALNIKKKCGEIAQNVFIELVELASFDFMVCGPEVLENLPTVIRILELEELEHERIDTDSKKKK